MHKVYILLLVFLFGSIKSQTYLSQNISLLSTINPNSGTVGIATNNQRYSGCWGWYQSSKNKEYAISGASIGTYFIDITNPTTPSVCAFVSGMPNAVHREIKTYQNYCYISVENEGPGVTFQIIDMQYLPDSVHIVHNSTNILFTGHTLFIDNNKLYVGTASVPNTAGLKSLAVFSLATPTAPVLIRKLNQDYPMINSSVHDMFVRNDTIYANCEMAGLFVFKLLSNNTFSQIGSYTNYAGNANYNHSCTLNKNGNLLMFCDEIPVGQPIRLVNVSNLSNITPVSSFNAYATTTPHNPYYIGNTHAVVSSYQDGLIIYNVSNPYSPFICGYFDTHPQGGAPSGTYYNYDYAGNWGAYPYLPSGNIIANDMQNGIFILNASAAYSATSSVTLPLSTVGVNKNNDTENELLVYPNPSNENVIIHCVNKTKGKLELTNVIGKVVYEKNTESFFKEDIDVSRFPEGTYVLKCITEEKSISKKIIIQHH